MDEQQKDFYREGQTTVRTSKPKGNKKKNLTWVGNKIKYPTQEEINKWIEDTFPEYGEDFRDTQKDENFDIKQETAKYAIAHIIFLIKELNSEKFN